MGKMLVALGVMVVIVGLTIAIWDFSQRLSAEPGEECALDEHCKAGNCLELATTAVCAEMCSSACNIGFRCVGVTPQTNAPELQGLGEMFYCLPSHLADQVEQSPPPPPAESVEATAMDTTTEEYEEGEEYEDEQDTTEFEMKAKNKKKKKKRKKRRKKKKKKKRKKRR